MKKIVGSKKKKKKSVGVKCKGEIYAELCLKLEFKSD